MKGGLMLLLGLLLLPGVVQAQDAPADPPVEQATETPASDDATAQKSEEVHVDKEIAREESTRSLSTENVYNLFDPLNLESFQLLQTESLFNQALTWCGLDDERQKLADTGIEFGLGMTVILQGNAKGGARTTNGHRITGSVDWDVLFDTGKMGLWEGGQFYLSLEQGWGAGIGGDKVGSLFAVNNDAIDDHAIIVKALWFRQIFLDDKLAVTLGRIDGGDYIDGNAYASSETVDFLNEIMLGSVNIPTPDNGMGIALEIVPVDWMYLNMHVQDADSSITETGFNTTFHGPTNFFYAMELGFLPVLPICDQNLRGTYRIGMWYDNVDREEYFNDLSGRLSPRMKTDSSGMWLSFNQEIYRENPDDDDDTQGLGMFARYGYAHGDVNEIEHTWSVGARYMGLIPTRDNDVLGFGFAQAIPNKNLQNMLGASRESVYELYYNAEIFPWLTITPDVQYICNPGADMESNTRDSLVFGLRLQMALL